MTDLYPIREFDGLTLSIMPRPRAGDWLEDEVAGWQSAGLEVVVSLLEPSEVMELGLVSEPELCERHAIQFQSFPIPDRGVPVHIPLFNSFIEVLAGRLSKGSSIGVHCRAGIGRSALVAACILVRAGIPYPLTFPAISRARRVQVPDTEQQEQWVRKFAGPAT